MIFNNNDLDEKLYSVLDIQEWIDNVHEIITYLHWPYEIHVLYACVCFCVHVCVCVGDETFEAVEIETLFVVCWYILTICK